MSAKPPRVSVIMPVYNGMKYVARALESLQRQTLKDFEAVLVDDGSKDGSAEAIRPFLEDPRFRLVSKGHEGIPQTRNRALAAAGGLCLAFLDQDDLYQPRKLEAEAAVLDADPGVGAVHTGVERIDWEGKSLGPRTPPARTDGDLFDAFLDSGVAAPLLSVMVRREVYETVGPFDESLFGTDDLDWLLRVAKAARFAFVPEPLVCQRLRPGTAGQTERMYTDRFVLAGKMRRAWPERRAQIDRFENAARYMYGSFLLSRRRAEEARREFAAAWRLRPADWRAAAKWGMTWKQ